MSHLRRIGALAALLLVAGLAGSSSAASPPAGEAVAYPRHCTPAELAAAQEDEPIGFGDCAGVSPGSYFELTNQDREVRQCQFGFAYRASDGRTYLAAPGSCYLAPTCLELLGIKLPVCIIIAYSDEEPYFPPGKGIPVRLPDGGRRIGELAYAIYDGTYDFALIRLDKGVPFTPQVCGIGGPVGLETAVRTSPETVRIAEGSFYGDAVAVRGLYHALRIDTVYGLPLTTGAPVLTTSGKAVGMGIGFGIGVGGGDIIQRQAQPLARASYRSRLKLTMLTAPLL